MIQQALFFELIAGADALTIDLPKELAEAYRKLLTSKDSLRFQMCDVQGHAPINIHSMISKEVCHFCRFFFALS